MEASIFCDVYAFCEAWLQWPCMGFGLAYCKWRFDHGVRSVGRWPDQTSAQAQAHRCRVGSVLDSTRQHRGQGRREGAMRLATGHKGCVPQACSSNRNTVLLAHPAQCITIQNHRWETAEPLIYHTPDPMARCTARPCLQAEWAT